MIHHYRTVPMLLYTWYRQNGRTGCGARLGPVKACWWYQGPRPAGVYSVYPPSLPHLTDYLISYAGVVDIESSDQIRQVRLTGADFFSVPLDKAEDADAKGDG